MRNRLSVKNNLIGTFFESLFRQKSKTAYSVLFLRETVII